MRHLRQRRSLRPAALAAIVALVPLVAAAGGPSAALPEGAVLDIPAGVHHGCALTPSRRVFCWGRNHFGQLGDGTNVESHLPVEVTGLGAGVLAVAAGGHTSCAISAEGRAFCWGRGVNGQIGDGDATDRWTPTAVEGLGDDVQAMTLGEAHVCALNRQRRVYCWGANGYGQIGDSSTTQRNLPVLVQGLIGGTLSMAAGRLHTCAASADGAAYCWGWNGWGQIGDGSTADRWVRTPVTGLEEGVTEVAAGHGHSCAATASRLYCWGDNSQGQLGDGSNDGRALAAPVRRMGSGVHGLTAGGAEPWYLGGHSCALTAAGRAYCWGRNAEGQVGDRSFTNRNLRRRVSRFADGVLKIVAGGFHSCALTGGGRVFCWGNNTYGQLGDGTTTQRSLPGAVGGRMHMQ